MYKFYVVRQFSSDESNFPLTQDFLSPAVRCGALAFVPAGGLKQSEGTMYQKQFPFDTTSPLTSCAVRCVGFCPSFFFHQWVEIYCMGLLFDNLMSSGFRSRLVDTVVKMWKFPGS